jgi:hypothetical protein
MTLGVEFFKGGETVFDVFYPTGYLLTVFPGGADLDGAAAALRAAGFAASDIGVAPGGEASALLHALAEHRGALVRFERLLASHRGDESYLEGELRDLAESGHGFLFAYAPSEVAAHLAADVVRPFGPVLFLRYGRLTITEWR